MTAICLYFQVHQPKRLRKYSCFELGAEHYYEDDDLNREIFLKVANKCYLPATKLLLKLIKQYPNKFKIAFSLSGVFVEQCERFSPETLAMFKELVATKQVELLDETYYHSLSALFSLDEFKTQIVEHHQLMQDVFDYTPTAFRNTELIYRDDIAELIDKLGYEVILAEGSEKILGWRSANYLYEPVNTRHLKLLLRNYRLTDDVAFRFSERTWKEYPLKADKYAFWLHALHNHAEIINLFMDFETFGEHQWKESGIFAFLACLPEYILRHPGYEFMTPTEAAQNLIPRARISSPEYLSWADVDRDLSAWRGNNLQEDALATIYGMRDAVYETHDLSLIKTWRSLLTSDHFYYMCTKYDADGDVHKYFNAYGSPYEAYLNYQNVVADFNQVITAYNKTESKTDLLNLWNLFKRNLGMLPE